jgi:hypothetical protein
MCELCGCSEPVVEIKRDPDELRPELEERRDESERFADELELEPAKA